jgi:hypothetical protein
MGDGSHRPTDLIDGLPLHLGGARKYISESPYRGWFEQK